VRMMEVEKQATAHEQTADAAIVKVMSPERSPQEKLAEPFRGAKKYAVHATKQTQAVAILNELGDEAAGILDRCDYGAIEAFRVKFGTRFYYAGLSTPTVEATPRERYAGTFVRWGWLGEEVDAALARIKPGESVKVDWDRFEVGGGTITREALRLGLKPRFSSDSDAIWLARFPQMKRAIIEHGDIVFTGTGSA
jgi:hypothetical protein